MSSDLVADRFAVDETSFNFRGLSARINQERLDNFAELLGVVVDQGHVVRKHPWALADQQCLNGVSLAEFLYSPVGAAVSRDTRLLTGLLLDRCRSWDEDEPGFVDAVVLDDGMVIDPGFSLGPAAARGVSGRAVACLMLGGHRADGRRTARAGGNTTSMWFVSDADAIPRFWRDIYAEEDVPEQGFFAVARWAFPRLVFHPALRFNRFEGGYGGVRDRVVLVLSGLCDRFAVELAAGRGLPAEIAARMSPYGVHLSPEAPSTRRNRRAMAERAVELDGRSYLCDWHAKLEPHRNRIHFSLPDQHPEGLIVIGVFARHLPT